MEETQNECDLTKLALLLLIPIGIAIYFWRKSRLLEDKLRNLEELYGRCRIERGRGRNYNTIFGKRSEGFCSCEYSDRPKTMEDVSDKQAMIIEGLCWVAQRLEKLKEDHDSLKEKLKPVLENQPQPKNNNNNKAIDDT